ncbi:MAG: dTDP-4-dehydrorhamnose reductase [Bacteroidota bacterium]
MKILVTGASGQLGSTLNALKGQFPAIQWVFKTSAELNVTQPQSVTAAWENDAFDYCINCAAYTNVDGAEVEREKAYDINVTGAKNLAIACAENNTVLIHISTDFVFDGFINTPYKEDDIARPIGFYGDTKFKGEQAVIKHWDKHFIIRTSWLYSGYGNNFMKTMLRLGQTKDEISVVYDQVGSPTHAHDLADFILQIIQQNSEAYGTYHYSNEGISSWYDFAKAIFELENASIIVHPITSESYPTPAERPKYSVLDKSKTKNTFGIDIPHWTDSLKKELSEKTFAN